MTAFQIDPAPTTVMADELAPGHRLVERNGARVLLVDVSEDGIAALITDPPGYRSVAYFPLNAHVEVI